MRKVARLNDRTMGSCTEHGGGIGGRIVSGSPDIVVNGRPVARVGDTVIADCGHVAKIVTGSKTVIPNGSPGTARINDRVGRSPYRGKIITSSPDTYADD